MSPSARLFVWLFAMAVRLFPRPLRQHHGAEMVADFADRYAALSRRGRGGRASTEALVFATRALLDAVRTGLSERRRAGAANARPVRRRSGRLFELAADLAVEMRLALRILRRSPGFSVAAIVVLALGIGANTAIFSAIRAALLMPPPYPEPERLALLELTDASTLRPDPPRPFPWSYPKLEVLLETPDLRADPIAAYASRTFTLTGGAQSGGTLTGTAEPQRLTAELVTPAYFDLLGAVPVAGRDFVAADDRPDSPPVTMLGYALWVERFGADPGIVGATVNLNDTPVTVAGVAPPGFRGLTGEARLWVPIHTGARLTAPVLLSGALAHWLQVFGRLRPGVELDELRAQMAAVGEAVEAAHPDTDPTAVRGGDARSLLEARSNPQARRSLLLLSTAAGLLLLAACANLAGLMLARAGDRGRENAVRLALGASRWRVARAHLMESLLLALAGGVAALGIARLGVDAIVAAWPARFLDGGWNLRFVDLETIRLDGGALAFALCLAVCAAVLAGTAPALQAARRPPQRGLRPGASLGGGGRRRLEPRAVLVAVEVAVALVLLVGAGLLLRSLERLQQVDRGFDAERLLVLEYRIPRTSRWAEDPAAFHQAYLERLRSLPEVAAASIGCGAPLAGHCWITGVSSAGGTEFPEGSRPWIGVHSVDETHFETLGIPVHRGRPLSATDRAGSPPVVVINDTAVRELFPDVEPLGQRVAMGIGMTAPDSPGAAGAEVVGVVGDVLYDRPEQGVMAEAYVSFRQEESGSTILLRTRGEPLAALPAARTVLAGLDPSLPIFGVRTLRDLEAGATADTRVLGLLLLVFAALALVLAATGVWALVAYAVSRSTRELGLRIALGAEAGGVIGMVLRRGLGMAIAGVVLGGLGALAASRALEGLLFEVAATDPVSFAVGAATLLLVASLAAWLPARRVSRIDPAEALRAD